MRLKAGTALRAHVLTCSRNQDSTPVCVVLLNYSIQVLASTFVAGTEAVGGRVPPPLPERLAGTTYGAALGAVSPWLSCGGGGVTVLARYGPDAGGLPSICWASAGPGEPASVFVGAPRPPVALWRALAAAAGVHLYIAEGTSSQDDGSALHADAVEVGGAGLLYHAGGVDGNSASGRGPARRRTVTLPRSLPVRSEWGEVVCPAATPCNAFETPPLTDGESILYWVG